jgi:hypothetical protein
MAGVFGGNQIDFLQHANRPKRYIFKVADGCGNNIKGAEHERELCQEDPEFADRRQRIWTGPLYFSKVILSLMLLIRSLPRTRAGQPVILSYPKGVSNHAPFSSSILVPKTISDKLPLQFHARALIFYQHDGHYDARKSHDFW